MIEAIREEVLDAANCEDCISAYYSREYLPNYFAVPCSRPHGLVWAQMVGFPFWPAKVIRFDKNELNANVAFFGGNHERAWIPMSSCFELTREYLWTCDSQHEGDLKLAIDDLKEHLKQLEIKFKHKLSVGSGRKAFSPKQRYIRQYMVRKKSLASKESSSAPRQGKVQKQEQVIVANSCRDKAEEDKSSLPVVMAFDATGHETAENVATPSNGHASEDSDIEIIECTIPGTSSSVASVGGQAIPRTCSDQKRMSSSERVEDHGLGQHLSNSYVHFEGDETEFASLSRRIDKLEEKLDHLMATFVPKIGSQNV
jgi:hypothetical protein